MDYFLVCVILTTLYTNQGDAYGKQLNIFTKFVFINIHVHVCLVKLNAVHVNVNHDFLFFFLVLKMTHTEPCCVTCGTFLMDST